MVRSILVLITMSLISCSNDSVDATGPYFPKVKAIIQSNCIGCHSVAGTGSPKGLPVFLETDQEIVDRAEAIKKATNDPASIRNKRMPYGGELSASDKDIILKWFEAGGTAAN